MELYMEDSHLSKTAVAHYTQSVCSDEAISELLDIVRGYTNHDLPLYSKCLTAAFDTVRPVFYRKRYAEFFWHCTTTVPGYLERVIVASSKGEGDGSEKLFELSHGIDYDPQTAAEVMRHANDEARHSRMFLRMTSATFPDFLSQEDIMQRESMLPDVRALQENIWPDTAERIPVHHLIDHLVQMNIGEIRTRLHMHLFAPVLHHVAPEFNRKQVRGLLEALTKDELRHISYTALLMESWAQDGDSKLISNLYQSRLETFNQLTVEHTESAIRSYGKGRFPDLLEL